MKIGKREPGKAGKIYMRFESDLEENDVIHIAGGIEGLQSQEALEVYQTATRIQTDLSIY